MSNENEIDLKADEQIDLEEYENKLDNLKESIKQLKKLRKKQEKIEKLEKEREHILEEMSRKHKDNKKKHK